MLALIKLALAQSEAPDEGENLPISAWLFVAGVLIVLFGAPAQLKGGGQTAPWGGAMLFGAIVFALGLILRYFFGL